MKSAKELGLEACLARDAEALGAQARARGAFGQGQVLVARELMPLRPTGESAMNFPHAREYRVICPPLPG